MNISIDYKGVKAHKLDVHENEIKARETKEYFEEYLNTHKGDVCVRHSVLTEIIDDLSWIERCERAKVEILEDMAHCFENLSTTSKDFFMDVMRKLDAFRDDF